MSVSKNSRRSTLTYPKDLYALLEGWAQEEDRTVNYIVIRELTAYAEKRLAKEKEEQ